MAETPLANGDAIVMSGVMGMVTSTKPSTNATGYVTFSNPYGGSQILAKVRAAGSPVRSLVVSPADTYFRCGLLYDIADPSRVGVIVDDPYWGRRISAPTVWHKCSAKWSTTLTMGDMYSVRLQENSVSQLGEWMDIVARWDTDTDGVIFGPWQPLYPYASLAWDAGLETFVDGGNRLGHFYTSTGGWAREMRPGGAGGSTEHRDIIAPCGHGAWGQRATDLMHAGGDAPTPEARLSSLWACYKQEPVELTAGASTTLNVKAVTVGITGPASAEYDILWDGSIRRPAGGGTLNASGLATYSGLPGGYYIVRVYHPTATGSYLTPQDITLIGSQVASLNFGAAYAVVPSTFIKGKIYAYDMSTAQGATIWRRLVTGEWQAWGTTDSNGNFSVSGGFGTDNIVVTHPAYGAASFDHVGLTEAWFSPQLSTRFGGLAVMRGPENPEGCFRWGPRGNHIHIPCGEGMGYMEDSELLTQYQFIPARGDGGGLVTEPAPRCRWEPADSAVSSMGPVRYVLYDRDATLLSISNVLQGSTRPPWTDSMKWYEWSPVGTPTSATFGGMIRGNVVQYNQTPIEGFFNPLPEADRMGLQWGDHKPFFTRVRPLLNATGVAHVMTASECAYCQGPVRQRANETARVRGYCENCGRAFADADAMDARTYFATPALAGDEHYSIRLLNQTRGMYHRSQRQAYWYRPEDYQEDDTYLTQSGRGTATNAPRWFAQHIHFGSYSGGVWTPNETISGIEASQGRTLGPCRVKAIFPATYGVYNWGGGALPSMRLIQFPDGVNALTSNHYLYAWTGQLRAHWTFHNTVAWEDSHEGTFSELWLDHFYSLYDADVEGWAESQFDLPPEPWFGVRLWRGEQNPEDWPSTQPPYSYIEFGKEFRILIPYGGNVQVYIAGSGDSWVELEPEQGEGLAGFGGTGEECKILFVGVLRGRILLAYDNFGEGTAFYKIPRGNAYCGQELRYNRYWAEVGRIEPPRVWSAPIKVGHYGGQYGFTWFPLNAFRNVSVPNRYECPYLPFGYYHTQAPSGVVADVWWEPRRDNWADAADLPRADAEWLVQPSVLVDTNTSETAANITLQWVPYEWKDGPDLTCTMTPAVFAAQLRQPANVSGTTSPGSTIISPGHAAVSVEEIQVEEPEEFGPSFLRLKINDAGSTLKTLRDFQRIKVELGEKIGASSTLATVFDGHVRNPEFDSTRGAQALVVGELYGFDDVRNLVDRKHEGREPDLELLSVTEAATWLCKAAGIPEGHINISTVMDTTYLHGGTRKSHAWGYSIEGYNGQQRWQPRFGAEFLPTLRDIAQHTNSQWYWTANARTVNLTNGYWPTTGYQYDLYEHNAPSGAYGLYSFDPERRTVDDEDFANYVHLRGRTDDGAPLDAITWDALSLFSPTAWNYTHGRRIQYVETRDDVRDQVALWKLAYSKLSQLCGRPRGATAEADLIPQLRRGQIVRTDPSAPVGGRLDDLDARNQRYLVTGYTHRWWRGQAGRTSPKLKWIGTG